MLNLQRVEYHLNQSTIKQTNKRTRNDKFIGSELSTLTGTHENMYIYIYIHIHRSYLRQVCAPDSSLCPLQVRRLVARTVAQQIGPEAEAASAPHQYAFSDRAGTECVAHLLQARTETSGSRSCLCGTFDLIARSSMLQGLCRLPGASAVLPFVQLFYVQVSEYVWTDDEGTSHHIRQAKEASRGTPHAPRPGVGQCSPSAR